VSFANLAACNDDRSELKRCRIGNGEVTKAMGSDEAIGTVLRRIRRGGTKE
jgi:hypothetical protein